ncbi:DUF2306 domain-containing protein [Roseateles asaccharophilus]|uniref:Membrane protein n=1 Tax=Roseateles asaccharophilus TaxID=582607 RepID=A0ABU2A788_9BURK|nr:DUF2306 domain-containing protein [Roseateles asaccharophilus]MDR7333066.1 putative membrane protein [Roseateles asaccharophilus]
MTIAGPVQPSRAVAAAARLWYVVAAAGLLLFAAYISISYGRAALGGPPGESRMAAGDLVGQGVLSVHLVFAALMTAIGVLQLIPALRRRAPALHRNLGRVFIVGAVLGSVSGFFLLWARGTVGGLPMHLAISLNGVLIVGFAWLAWRSARERRFVDHRRWALRLFMAANGVWFFRVGLMAWLMVWQAPVGFDPKTFTGPFVYALSFAQFLVPLAVLELYLRVRGRGMALVVTLVLLSLVMAGGIVGAAMGLWMPRLLA